MGSWCLPAAAVVLLLLPAGCITAGRHSIPKLVGVVVDRETGEPVEGARLSIAYMVAEGGIHMVDTPGEYPCCGGEAVTGPDGRFELPGYWGPEGTSGGNWSVFRKGYVPLRFTYAASRKSGKVWFTWSPADQSWKRNLSWRWEGRHVFVTVRLEPVTGTDPALWQRYLEGLASKAEGYGPVAWDFRHILLDEAYRYVSQGGELTEGIAWTLTRCPGISDRRVDGRTDAIERALLCYCTGVGRRSSLCTEYLDSWVRVWRRWLDCKEAIR